MHTSHSAIDRNSRWWTAIVALLLSCFSSVATAEFSYFDNDTQDESSFPDASAVSFEPVQAETENADFHLVNTQPESPLPPLPPESRPRRRSRISGRRRLASVPDMFGDFQSNSGVVTADTGNAVFTFDLPTAGYGRYSKVADNNKALTDDRIYFLYNHFHNSHRFQRDAEPIQDAHVDRYTLGFERSFHDGLWSAELRMPIVGDLNFKDPEAQVDGGSFGNLSIIVKRMLRETDTTAIACGLGIDVPTGGDVAATFLIDSPVPDRLRVRNDAVHLSPYAGFAWMPNDRFFAHGFMQLEIAANGNAIQLNGNTAGVFTEQNLLMLDFGVGKWLARNPDAHAVTGIASLFELHFATTVQESDFLRLAASQTSLTISNPAKSVDVLNLTCGLHFELACGASLRVAGVVPIGHDRYFDAEIWAAFVKPL